MSFACEFDHSRRVLFVFIEGTIDLRDALKSIVDAVSDGRFDPRYDALASSMGPQRVGAAEGAWAIADLLKKSAREFETRIAVAAPDRDLYDLGRLAAIRLNQPGTLQMEVFSTLLEARRWFAAS